MPPLLLRVVLRRSDPGLQWTPAGDLVELRSQCPSVHLLAMEQFETRPSRGATHLDFENEEHNFSPFSLTQILSGLSVRNQAGPIPMEKGFDHTVRVADPARLDGQGGA